MKLMKVSSSSGAAKKKIVMIAAVIRPIAISSHIPARVSAILRSSTETMRVKGTGRVPVTSRVMVLMPELLG
jgi:hypothetical protein